MAVRRSEDPRLTHLAEILLTFPETVRRVNGRHAAFLVRKRTFAYYLDGHHGDGIVAVSCKVFAGENTALVARQPSKFYLPAYIGSKGWIALRLDMRKIGWGEVTELARGSYMLVAPKRLAERVGRGT
jgi:hypothetical protein